MAKRFLYLVRHGNFNTYEQPADDLGGKLTQLGRDQAYYAGKHLAKFEQMHAIHASTLRRAMETAEVIAYLLPRLEIQPTPLLRESIPYVPDHKREEFFGKYPHMTEQKVAENQAIADQAFDKYFQPFGGESDLHEILVTHGNLIRYLVCRAIKVDVGAWVNMLPFQGGITRFMIEEDGKILMLSFNETAHIPLEMQTEL